jgi:branched-chain amino acid transport system permease protein
MRIHGNFRHPHPGLFGPAAAGLVNGAFYAMLSLGLAVIFGLLNVVNFAHGALYMLGAFSAWIMLDKWGMGTGCAGAGAAGRWARGCGHRAPVLKHLYKLDPMYGLLLTFGLSLIIEGIFREQYGVSGQATRCPSCCRAPPTWAS